jgi:glycosyltransferase involved in cell wall biosynthesis
MPVYNPGPFIQTTLDTALQQDYPCIEFVVVDDGSTDGTFEVLQEFSTREPRLHVYRQENQGVCNARNAAISHARGEYIAPLDQDDIWHPSKIRLQVEAFNHAGPEVGVVYTWCSTIDGEGRILRRDAGRGTVSGNVFLDLIKANFMACASTPLFRRSALEESGLYDQAHACVEDLDIYIRLAERFSYVPVPQYLTGYRLHFGNVSGNHRRMMAAFNRLVDSVHERHPSLPSYLFHKSKGNYAYHLSIMAAKSHDFALAARMMIRALAHDPRLAARLLRMATRRFRRVSGISATGETASKGKAFEALDPASGN